DSGDHHHLLATDGVRHRCLLRLPMRVVRRQRRSLRRARPQLCAGDPATGGGAVAAVVGVRRGRVRHGRARTGGVLPVHRCAGQPDPTSDVDADGAGGRPGARGRWVGAGHRLVRRPARGHRMRLLRGIILVVTAVVSIGYGRYVVGAGSDPLHGLRGPYLIGYGIAPLICVLAASDAWRAARDVVLVRSGSVSRWWRDRVGAGATAGGQIALAMVGGTMVARVGLPVPSVGEVVASVLAPVLVVLGIT